MSPKNMRAKMIDMVTQSQRRITRHPWIHKETAYISNSRFPREVSSACAITYLPHQAGEAIMAHRFLEYQPWKGDIERRTNGSLIAMEAGTAYAYALDKLQDRGRFFIFPQEEVYAGQVAGENAKEGDIVVNVTKSKKLTNMRASGADEKARIIPPIVMSLEDVRSNISKKTNISK